MVFSIMLLLYTDNLSTTGLILLLVAIGVFSSSEILCFGASSHFTVPETSGTILGVINTFNILGSASIMQIVGFLLDYKWNGALDEQGIRIYSSIEYIFALSSILIFVFVLGIVAFLFYKSGKKQDQAT
jgi:MFS family permease